MFDPPGTVWIQSDDGETPACFSDWDDALDFCAALLASRRPCSNCHWYLDYPLTHTGGWCNRGPWGVPTSPDFHCKAWEPIRSFQGLTVQKEMP